MLIRDIVKGEGVGCIERLKFAAGHGPVSQPRRSLAAGTRGACGIVER